MSTTKTSGFPALSPEDRASILEGDGHVLLNADGTITKVYTCGAISCKSSYCDGTHHRFVYAPLPCHLLDNRDYPDNETTRMFPPHWTCWECVTDRPAFTPDWSRRCCGGHQCGICGQMTWIEFHGMADGRCTVCGHRG